MFFFIVDLLNYRELVDSADYYWKSNVDTQSNIKACTETKASTSEGINWVACSSTFNVYVWFKLA